MVLVWHFGDADGLGLYGAIAIYFGSGAVLMRWRDTVLHDRGKWLRIASALVVSGVLMYFIGALLLGHVSALVGGLLIVVAVFGTYPVGLSGLSALAIAWLAESEERLRKWGRLGGLGALAVFVVLTGVTVAVSRSPWLLLVMGILGLLMVAQASATQADIVAIVAVLALMGVTPAAVSGPAEPTGTRGRRARGSGRLVHVRVRARRVLQRHRRGRRRPVPALADLLGGPGRKPPAAFTGLRTSPVRARDGQRQPQDPARPLERAGDEHRHAGARPHPARDDRSTRYAACASDLSRRAWWPDIGGNDAGFSTVGTCVRTRWLRGEAEALARLPGRGEDSCGRPTWR